MDHRFTTVLLVLVIILGSNAQLKRQLEPCYNESAIPGITTANNRPPTNLNIFLELLRRLEDANPTLNVRDFSAIILQRLRQNGIILTSGRSFDLSLVIPFSPQGLENIKGSFILDNYLPNPNQELFYGDLDQSDLCYLHYMISDSINSTIRGDESMTCLRSAQYQARMRRDTEGLEQNTESFIEGDKMNADTEQVETLLPRNLNRIIPTQSSQCPIELGVVYTNHGTVKIGQVLLGLSSGYNEESVGGIDVKYANTLSGALANFALAQAQIPLQCGTSGGWNSTINPKYFFLEKNTSTELTDQDIRGSLDAFLLAFQVNQIRSKYTETKLSQILDMYYSPAQRGVFDSTFRACNRNNLYTKSINVNALYEQTLAVMVPLYKVGNYPFSAGSNVYPVLSEAAINNFTSYFSRINDPACPQIDGPTERVDTDLLIFLDPSLSYNRIQPLLSYILDNIDVNKYGSRYTLYSGADAANITNNTHNLLEFHKNFNISVHEKLSRQYDYSKIYEVMESTIKSKLNNNTYTGGESTIVLLVTGTTPSQDQRNFLEQRKEIIRQFLPDVTVLVLGNGVSTDYSSVLLNPSRDFITLSTSNNDNDLRSTAQNVIDRIKAIPRSIVNPNCGSDFSGSSNTFTMNQYVDLNSINYYKVAPNYFFVGDGGRNLKITELSTGSITICLSRDQSRPNNQTSDCRTLQGGVHTVDISSYCGGSFGSCDPIYLSIYGNTTQYRCRDFYCRFPDSIKYAISLENVGCTSGSFAVISNFFLIAVLSFYLVF